MQTPTASTFFMGKWYPWWIAVVLLSLVPGLFTPLMEPDAALYAGISKQMVWRNDWVNLFANGADWLDKPHLPFWITALSFKAFGISTFSYKLPAFICWLAAAWYTGIFTRHFYGKNTARMAVLIFLTALHGIISINDVRAEPYLTFFLIAASLHLVKAHTRLLHLFPAALFTACAIMTKGPFTLIPIGGGLLLHWVIRGEWKQLLHWKWWLYLLLTALFVLPEIWCLYLQFDAQPHKLVFGKNQVSGIRFFLWDSQFGRFFNTGPIKGKGDPFFFLHTLLWAFLPWSLLLYASLAGKVRSMFGKKEGNGVEWISLGAGLLTLLVFSLSRFQLPHYLNILFPYFSILLAAWLVELEAKGLKRAFVTQRVISLLMVLLPVVVSVIFRPSFWWLHLVLSAGMLVAWKIIPSRSSLASVITTGTVGAVAVSLFLNIFFYPELLRYQGGSVAASWKNNVRPGEPVHFFQINSYAFEFYTDAPVTRTQTRASLVYTGRTGKLALDSAQVSYHPLQSFSSFPVTRLNGRFLSPKTRASRLDTVWLLRVNPVELNILEKN